ncbi:carbon storage regulator CsrA [Tepidibacter formicigenes]|jgi:carbon storage regulator|uniref:Translational regulator CsrA n=1 Tax=Tepidibacter formicigenes DSM 15518 TaxID=1123349 RepID=A0A1M6P0N4_9FIRM|nr:carbon storage regulator CsrA [Tepidibacter formicigenes]SHK01491.1 carbon storage regulator, CsrA [Tepidibacter formicigenes DSM 15518]
MLILSRKQEESIIINEDVEVVVLGISEGKVKLGIKAPKNVEILRKEVKEAIVEENKEAIGKMDISKLKKLIKK